MTYQFYKVLHIASVVGFFVLMSMAAADMKKTKFRSIVSGIASLAILVAGMGLMARLGIKHSEGWPLWIKLKFGIWAIITIGAPVVLKRLPVHMARFMLIAYVLLVVAVYSAIYKI